MDIKKQELKNQLAKDYHVLRSLLADGFRAHDRQRTSHLLKDFFDIQETATIPYNGLVLLDREKRVFNAYSIKAGREISGIVGSRYTGIEFQGSDKSLHKVLILYRTDKQHPMGHKGIEIAFEMKKDNEFLGWIVFQMDMDMMEETYAIDEEGLKKYQFKRP